MTAPQMPLDPPKTALQAPSPLFPPPPLLDSLEALSAPLVAVEAHAPQTMLAVLHQSKTGYAAHEAGDVCSPPPDLTGLPRAAWLFGWLRAREGYPLPKLVQAHEVTNG